MVVRNVFLLGVLAFVAVQAAPTCSPETPSPPPSESCSTLCSESDSCSPLLNAVQRKCRKAFNTGLRRHCSKVCADAFDKLVANEVGACFDQKDFDGRSMFLRACKAKHGKRNCEGKGLSCHTSHEGPKGERRPCRDVMEDCSLDKCCREALFQFLYGDNECIKVLGYLNIGPKPKCPKRCYDAYERLAGLDLGFELLTCACHELGAACVAELPRRNFETLCDPDEQPEPKDTEPIPVSLVESCGDVVSECVEDDECRCLLTRAYSCINEKECSTDCYNNVQDLLCHPISSRLIACDCKPLGSICLEQRLAMLEHPCSKALLGNLNCPTERRPPPDPENCPSPDCQLALAYCLTDDECATLFHDLYTSKECSPALTDMGVTKPPPRCPSCCRDRFLQFIELKRAKYASTCLCGDLGTICTLPQKNLIQSCLAPVTQPICKDVADECINDTECNTAYENFYSESGSCSNVFQYSGYAPLPECSADCILAERQLRSNTLGAKLFDCDCGDEGEECHKRGRNFELYCSTCPREQCPDLSSACQDPVCQSDLTAFLTSCTSVIGYDPTSGGNKPKCDFKCAMAAMNLLSHNSFSHQLDCDTCGLPSILQTSRDRFITICPDFRISLAPYPVCSSCNDITYRCNHDHACRIAWENFGKECNDVILYDEIGESPKCTSRCIDARNCLFSNPIGQEFEVCDCQHSPACLSLKNNYFKYCDPKPAAKCLAIQEQCIADESCKAVYNQFGTECFNVLKYSGTGPEPTCSPKCVALRSALVKHNKDMRNCDCDGKEMCSVPRGNFNKFCPCSEIVEQCEDDEECSRALEAFLSGPACTAAFEKQICTTECARVYDQLVSNKFGKQLSSCSNVLGDLYIERANNFTTYCQGCARLLGSCIADETCQPAHAGLFEGDECKEVLEQNLDDGGTPVQCTFGCLGRNIALLQHPLGRLFETCDCDSDPDFSSTCKKARMNFFSSCPRLTSHDDSPSSCARLLDNCFRDSACSRVFNLATQKCSDIVEGKCQQPICRHECQKLRTELQVHLGGSITECDCGSLGPICEQFQSNIASCPAESCSTVIEECSANQLCGKALQQFIEGKECANVVNYCSGDAPVCTQECIQTNTMLVNLEPRFETCDCGDDLGCVRAQGNYMKFCPLPDPVVLSCHTTCEDAIHFCRRDATCRGLHDSATAACENVLFYDNTSPEPGCSQACKDAEITLHAFFKDKPTSLRGCKCSTDSFIASVSPCTKHTKNMASFCNIPPENLTPLCDDVVTECQGDSACSNLYNLYTSNCENIISGESTTCSDTCIAYYYSLVMDPIGKKFESCECKDDNALGCSLGKLNAENHCVSLQCSAGEHGTCHAVFAACREDDACRSAMAKFDEDCEAVSLYSGSGPEPECPEECALSAAKFLLHYAGKCINPLNCECGTSRFGEMCSLVRNNIQKFCNVG